VAIKVLREELATDPEVVMRFLRERSVLLRLTHPNIVRVRDLVVEGDLLALVMDLVDGPDLHRYLRENGPLSPAAGALLMAQVTDALAASHADGIVHRDLKPANVLLATGTSQGFGGQGFGGSQGFGSQGFGPGQGFGGGPVMRPMLTDFGIARLADSPGITQTQEFVGTPAYVAPESAEGRPQTSAVDVYGAGIMLYELVTGRPPFQGDNPLQILQAHLTQEPQRPRHLPEPLWTVIARCLSKSPDERPGSVALAQALRVVADGIGVHASPAQIDAAERVGALLVPDAAPTQVLAGVISVNSPAAEGAPTVRGLRNDPAAATILSGGLPLDGEGRTQVLPTGAADRTQVLPPTGAADRTQALPHTGADGTGPLAPESGGPGSPHPWEQQLQAARTRNEQTQRYAPLPPDLDPRTAPQVAPRPYTPRGPNGSSGTRAAAPAPAPAPAGRPQTAPPPYAPTRGAPASPYVQPPPAPYQEPYQEQRRRPEPRREREREERPRRQPRPPRLRRAWRLPGGGCLRMLIMLAIIAAVVWYFTPLQHWIHNVENWWQQITNGVNKVRHTIPTSVPTSLKQLGG
jgi:serine/threonine-protein kinase